MGQRMLIFRDTVLVNVFTYPGEDGPEMLDRMKADWDRYTSAIDDDLGPGEWTCDCRHIPDASTSPPPKNQSCVKSDGGVVPMRPVYEGPEA